MDHQSKTLPIREVPIKEDEPQLVPHTDSPSISPMASPMSSPMGSRSSSFDDLTDNPLYMDYDSIEPVGLDVGIHSPTLERIRLIGKNEREKLSTLVRKQKEELKRASKKPVNVRLRDKLSFTIGITDVALTMFLLGYMPKTFYWSYLIKFPILMAIRYYVYHKSKFHYFLLDFCYFANLLFMVYLLAFPQSCTLFQICFSFINGPLMFAILAWRNSMVFHSVDKVTSMFIHLSPTLVTWTLRWFGDDKFNTCSADQDSLSIVDMAIIPLLPYCLWQLAYYIKVQLLDRYKFQVDPQYMTSFRFLMRDKKHFLYPFVNAFGKKHRIWMYGLAQLIYTFVTMLPVKFYFQSFWLHTTFIFAMCVISAWNGATFYVDVFSVKYQQNLQECEKQWDQLSKAIQMAKSDVLHGRDIMVSSVNNHGKTA